MFTAMLAPKAVAGSTLWTYGSEVDATNGGADDQTHVTVLSGLSAGLTDIEIIGWGLGTDTNDEGICVQLGDSGGFENTGYDNSVKHASASENRTTGFFSSQAAANDAGDEQRAVWRLIRWDTSSHLWFCYGFGIEATGTAGRTFFGYKTLSGELTQVRITTDSETSNFDEGSVIGRYA